MRVLAITGEPAGGMAGSVSGGPGFDLAPCRATAARPSAEWFHLGFLVRSSFPMRREASGRTAETGRRASPLGRCACRARPRRPARVDSGESAGRRDHRRTQNRDSRRLCPRYTQNADQRRIAARSSVASGDPAICRPAALSGLTRRRLQACSSLSKAESKARRLGSKSTLRTNSQASLAPWSRSMPMSSHSTLKGPW